MEYLRNIYGDIYGISMEYLWYNDLAGGWALPHWKIWKSIGMIKFSNIWKNKIHLPNQPLGIFGDVWAIMIWMIEGNNLQETSFFLHPRMKSWELLAVLFLSLQDENCFVSSNYLVGHALLFKRPSRMDILWERHTRFVHKPLPI